MSQVDYQLKFILIGNSSVGKTSIVRRFLNNDFEAETIVTIGLNIVKTIIELEDSKKKVQISINDTEGQECFWHALPPNYFRNAQGILLVYDVTDQSSFDALERWDECCEVYCPDHKVIILIGNKSDCLDTRKISTEMGMAYANNNNMIFMETSAKTDNNVQEAFLAVTEGICTLIDDNKFENTLNIDDSVTAAIRLSFENNFREQNKKKCKC